MSEMTVVIGEVTQIKSGTTKNGKPYTLHKVTDGNGESLGTCFADLANIARGFIGQRAVVVNERDGDYLNLKSVEAAPEPAANSDGPTQEMWDAKERRGHRRAAVAIAASFYSGNGTDGEADTFDFAERILEFVYEGAADGPEFVAAAQAAQSDSRAPLDDDDIPF